MNVLSPPARTVQDHVVCMLFCGNGLCDRYSRGLEIVQEPPTVSQGGGSPPSGWPVQGTLTYENITAIYRAGLPPVLRGLDFTIKVLSLVQMLCCKFLPQVSKCASLFHGVGCLKMCTFLIRSGLYAWHTLNSLQHFEGWHVLWSSGADRERQEQPDADIIPADPYHTWFNSH